MEEVLTVTRALSATLFVLNGVILGFMAGGFAGGRLLSVGPGPGGWDRLADALGGGTIGTLIGLVSASWAVRRITHRRRWAWGAGMFVAALALFAYMQANPIHP